VIAVIHDVATDGALPMTVSPRQYAGTLAALAISAAA